MHDLENLDECIDPEACPGCGCMPGDGVNPDCNNQDGCGHFNEYYPVEIRKQREEREKEKNL